MIADYNEHINHSNGSTYHMGAIILQGIKLGINDICFTEHVDYLLLNYQLGDKEYSVIGYLDMIYRI